MKKLVLILSLLTLPVLAQEAPIASDGAMQPAWENPYQNMGEGQSSPGYSDLDWSPDKILQLRLREGMVTVINFPAWETIQKTYIGEIDLFNAEPVAKNTLMVSPQIGTTGNDTNMVVFGVSGNKYAFYLKSEPVNTDTITNTIVNIRASQKQAGKTSKNSSSGVGSVSGAYIPNNNYDAGEQDYSWIKSIPIDPTEFRFDLDIFVPNPDDYVIAPERVWRDKVFTYIDFGEKSISMTQRPVVSILVEQGEAPVSYKTDGPNSRLVVVEGIGDLVLRNGQRLVCIKKRDKPFLVSQYPNGNMIGSSSFEPKMNMEKNSFEEIYQTEKTYKNNLIASDSIQQYEPVRKVDYPSGYYLPGKQNPFVYQQYETVAIEVASAPSIANLQKTYDEMIMNENFNEIVQGLEPFYSVETSSVDDLGLKPYRGNEVFRLRLKPAVGELTLEQGRDICQKLSKKNINCNVTRIQ